MIQIFPQDKLKLAQLNILAHFPASPFWPDGTTSYLLSDLNAAVPTPRSSTLVSSAPRPPYPARPSGTTPSSRDDRTRFDRVVTFTVHIDDSDNLVIVTVSFCDQPGH